MPMKDWSNDTYHPGWVYISGHTHHDYFTTEDGLEVYADNQVGYKKMTHSFKYIFNSTNFDYFADYNDGIYPITKRDYLIFNFSNYFYEDDRFNTITFKFVKKGRNKCLSL